MKGISLSPTDPDQTIPATATDTDGAPTDAASTDQPVTTQTTADEVQFADLNLSPKVLKAVVETGYTTPTPIQAGAIPPALEGRDVLGIAQTGTGKTASFVLPMITNLGRGRARARMPRSLVLCPTRELAAQVAANFDTYAKYTKLTKALLIGGVSFKEQDTAIDRGVDVLIATPGRLLDHFERGKLILNDVKIMVVDEADRMLDMGFIPDIERIFGMVPFTRQTLFFSATMAPEIERITNTFLSNPAKIEVARAATANVNIKQGVVLFKGTRKDAEPGQKRDLLRALIEAEGDGCTNAIIFCNRKSDVDIVAKSMKKHGLNAEAIHGDLDQSHRTRTLNGFRDGSIKFLVASDVAARGLDIPAVSHVFNFDVPSHAEDYIHRIGRTGRAGLKGTTIMICVPRDEKNLADVERLVQNEIPRLDDPRGQQAAPTGEVVDDGSATEERSTRTRSRRGRKPDAAKSDAAPEPAPENKTQPAPETEPTAKAAPQDDATPDNTVRDAAARDGAPLERRPRGGRGRQGGAEPTQPASDNRGEQNQRGGNRGGARRDNNQIVGMGDDAPTFIALSFSERGSS